MSGWSMRPEKTEVKAGQVIAWCACGKTSTPPYCDGNHRGSEERPVIEKFEEDATVYICGCGKTRKAPRCDGEHRNMK